MTKTHIKILGARGSIPVSGTQSFQCGGNTTCFALVVEDVVVAFFEQGLAASTQQCMA